ncbi:protein kinase [Candidatus Uabimicrobium sp. HlEnr_7]|uniref:protein kinase domain-containing protein n=1 Tax=Candidatus Uabimicrobium helgolandensis TaxID=3095367 RepID=UPI0035566F14
MERNPSSKNNKKQNKKNENQETPLYAESIDAIPSNEFGIEDDSIISNLDMDAVPVDSELITTAEDVEQSDIEDSDLMNSQYLALPSDIQATPQIFAGPPIIEEPTNKNKYAEKKEFETKREEIYDEGEEDDPIADTIICSTDIEEEDSVPDIPTVNEQGLLNTETTSESDNSEDGILDSALQSKIADPDVVALFKEQSVMEDSAILAAEAVEEMDVDVEEAMYADGTFEVESIGEDTFLAATKSSSSSEEDNFSHMAATRDIASKFVPKVDYETEQTKDLDFPIEMSSSQNLPTRDISLTATMESSVSIPATSPFNVGDIIDNRYKIIDFLGRGGMAFVYKVEHQLLTGGKHFALKVLAGHGNKVGEFSKRFKREVAVMMEFSHPHVIPIRDFGVTPDNQPYFTMDYCSGNVVKETIETQGALDIEVTLKIALQTLEALREAHKKNIIHRDLKPENIMFEMRGEEPFTYVLDFGIAKSLTTEYTEKLTQGVIGTLLYMSPEQATAQDLTIATDIYSLGASLYHMLTGRAPFIGTQQEVLIKIVQESPLPPSYVRKGIPTELDGLILKALAKKVDERYASADEFVDAINAILESEDIKSVDDKSISTLQARQAFTPGDVVNNRYRIVDVLGSGGMGIVYKVEHLELSSSKRFFALKLLDPKLSNDNSFKDRFVREIEMAMEFTHENVIQIRDFGHTKEGHYYYTMDHSSGKTLTNTITKNGKLDLKRSLNIVRQVLSALKGPHQKNIAHRDLKPDNIIIENRGGKDHALVLDFGIAKILDDNSQQKITQESIIGTPHYMSTEQAGGEKIDFRTDFYSVGVVLFEMLTGKVPFDGSTKEVLVAHVLKKPPQPSLSVPRLPLAVEELVLKSLEKDPRARFANAQEFIDAIDNIEIREKKLLKRNKIRKIVRFMTTVIFLMCIAGTAFLFLHIDKENRKIEQQFQAAVANSNERQAKIYLEEIKNTFFGANTFIFPNKITRLSLQIEFQRALESEDLVKSQDLYMQIQKMPSSTPELLIDLQQNLDTLHSKRFNLYQVARALNKLQPKVAKTLLNSQETNSGKKLGELITYYLNMQEHLKNKQYENAKRIIEIDISPCLAILDSKFSLQNFSGKIQQISQNLSAYNETESKKEIDTKGNIIIANIEQALQQSNIRKVESLLKELDKYSQVDYETKQKYSELLSQEKRFLSIKKKTKSDSIKAYELFLAANPKTNHRYEIESILRQDLQGKFQQAQKKYVAKKYEATSEILKNIVKSSIFKKIPRDTQTNILTILTRIYYLNRDREIFLLEKRWEKTLKKTLALSQVKSTLEAKIYMAIAYSKKDKVLSAKLLSSLKSHLRNLKTENLDEVQKKAYEEAFKLFIKTSKNKEKVILKFIRLFPKNYSYYNDLGKMKLRTNKSQASKYFAKYLEAIDKKSGGAVSSKLSGTDKYVINQWLSLQNFFPLKVGYAWKYENRNLRDQNIKQPIQTIEKKSKNTYTRLEQESSDKSAARITIFIEKNVIKQKVATKNANFEIIPQKVKVDSVWQRKINKFSNFKVQVVGYKVPVKEYKNIQCLKVKIQSVDLSKKIVMYEYYAPNVGLVKMERIDNGKKSFETILKKFKGN